jgi:TPR repeat protein
MGIPPAARGMPQIEVAFDIDANGILHVSARDKATGKENKITIKANSGLSEAEIQKMVKDAEINAAEDHKRVELVNARNQGEAMVHSVRKSLTEHGDKIGDEDKGRIDDAIKALEEAVKGEDKEAIDKRTAELATASQKLGELMYAKMQAEQGDAEAQNMLGYMHDNGLSVTQSDDEAVRWYRLAAAQGYALAQYNMGVVYENGRGVPQNDAEAVRWYRLAADQGKTLAQSTLGFLYENGRGVPQNDVEAYKWWSLASAQGHGSAAKNRDTVRARMTPAQIAEGQRLASAWKPK